MERGSYCYFCGTQLVNVESDPFGACYECFKCPPVTHWRWNEDTEFLQLYVAGETCPYCNLQVPDSESEARTPVVRHTPAAPAPIAPPPVIEAAPIEAPAPAPAPAAHPLVANAAPSEAAAPVAPPPVVEVAPPKAPVAVRQPQESAETKAQPAKKPGKPVTVDEVLWGSVVEWCRANNGHDTRNHHNCSKELARMQAKGEAEVVWHNRDRVPGTGELIKA